MPVRAERRMPGVPLRRSAWAFLDLTPFGLQEDWEDSQKAGRKHRHTRGGAGTTSTTMARRIAGV